MNLQKDYLREMFHKSLLRKHLSRWMPDAQIRNDMCFHVNVNNLQTTCFLHQLDNFPVNLIFQHHRSPQVLAEIIRFFSSLNDLDLHTSREQSFSFSGSWSGHSRPLQSSRGAKNPELRRMHRLCQQLHDFAYIKGSQRYQTLHMICRISATIQQPGKYQDWPLLELAIHS